MAVLDENHKLFRRKAMTNTIVMGISAYFLFLIAIFSVKSFLETSAE